MSRLNPFSRTADWSDRRLDWIAFAVFLVGLGIRLWAAPKSFVNPDEAYHALLASPKDWGTLFHSSLRSPRPPLFIILLHFVRQLSHSDLALRMISVAAGSLFPVIVYRWIAKGWGKFAALGAMAILTLAPELINLSVQARCYMMALFFMASSLYLLDAAIESSSRLKMVAFCVMLYLAILSNYSMTFFVIAAGVYFLFRIREKGVTQDVRIIWELGQVGVVILYAFLYVVQIHPLHTITRTRADITGWLAGSYPQPGQNPLLFLILGTAKQFAFLFPLLVPAVAAIILFLIGLYLLWRRGVPGKFWQGRATVALLVTPFIAACIGSFFYVYPYGRTYHSIFLALFIATGVSIALDRVGRGWIVPLVVVALIGTPLYHLTIGQHRGDVAKLPYRQHYMKEALSFLQSKVPPGTLILTASEMRVLLIYYLEDGDREPETRGQPSVEKVGDWRLFCNRWGLTSLDDLRNDLRVLRGHYKLTPEDRIWVMDGGFLTLLEGPLRELRDSGQIDQMWDFGKAMVIFQTPPGFLWEDPTPGDVIPPEGAEPAPTVAGQAQP